MSATASDAVQPHFLNRWNDTLATDLEAGPRDLGERVLAVGGWTGGKHLHPG